MKTYKIFTAGKMGELPYDQQLAWRWEIEDMIREATLASVVFVHPPMFYQYNKKDPENDIESMNWEINQLIDSDIVIVDLRTISGSIGTHMELGVIAAVNKVLPKNIYVVGFGKPDIENPWIENGVFHSEETAADAVDYIVNNLLI